MSRTAAILKASLLLVLTVLWGGCQTVQRDLTVDKLPENAFAVLDAFERQLVALEAGTDREALTLLRDHLAQAKDQPVMDSTYAARLAALNGRAALAAGDRALAERELKKALSLHSQDELARVLEARLEKNPGKSLALLNAALPASDGQHRIQAERGRLLASEGRYADALAAFDASLPFLPAAYDQAYGSERRKALALRDTASTPQGGSSYLTDKPLTLQAMAALTQSESPLLDFLTGGKTWASGVLFERLRSGGYYLDSSAPGSFPVRRGDAAFFLWRLVANQKNDKTLLRRYSDRYLAKTAPGSPVPDVPLGSPWFDAVLGCVEREIMELPDGRLFYPQNPVTGLDFYRWLKKAAEL